MRINLITPKFNQLPVVYNKQDNYMTNNFSDNKIEQHNTSNKNALPMINPYYNISFYGYSDDKEFLNQCSDIIANDIFQTNDNTKQLQNSFAQDTLINTLEKINKNNPQLYSDFLSKKNKFKIIINDFNSFAEQTFSSMDAVRNDDKKYTSFWENNAKIGNIKISDIIKNSDNTQQVNSIIKNSEETTYNDIKEKISEKWLENELNNLSKNNTEKNISLNGTLGNKVAEAHQLFDKNSIAIIFDKSKNSSEKIEAFKFLNTFVNEKLYQNNGKELDDTLNQLFEIKNSIDKKSGFESVQILKNEIMDFYKISKSQFDKDELKNILKENSSRINYIKKAEKINPEINEIPGYQNLDIDQKFFTAYYFNCLNKLIGKGKTSNIYREDFLKLIISDRNIETPEQIIDNLVATIDNTQNLYFNNLDNYYDILQNSEFNNDVQFPTKISYNPTNNLSLENMYLSKLNKKKMFYADVEEQRKFLRTLTKDEFSILNEQLKKDWEENELPFVMFREVRKQAYNTSIGINICNELKKVNSNLDDIKVKMDNMVYSFDKFVKMAHTIKNTSEEDKVKNNCAEMVADLKRNYNSMSDSEKAQFDEAIENHIPSIIDELKQNLDSKEDKDMLDMLKKQCKNKNHSGINSSAFLNTMNTILISRAIYNTPHFINSAAKASMAHHTLAGLGVASSTTGTTTASMAGTAGTAGGGFVAPVGPITAALFIIGGCALAVTTSISKAKKLESQQRPLTYTLDYNT